MNSMTQGALALARAGSISETAAKLNCSKRSVSAWRAGQKLPSDSLQTRLEAVLAIPRSAWTLSALVPPNAATPEAPAAPEGTSEQQLEAQSAIERLRDQMRRLAAARAVPGLSDRSRIEAERTELAASKELARLEGRDVSLVQVLGSRPWAELQAKITRALDNSPWALAKVFAECSDDKKAYADRMRASFPELVAAVEQAESELLKACEARAAKRTGGAQ